MITNLKTKPKQQEPEPGQQQEQDQQQDQEQEQTTPLDHFSRLSTSIDPHGSPRSLLSWHGSDLVSIPNSSHLGSEVLSDDRDDYSDLDNDSHSLPSRNHSPHQEQEQSHRPHHSHPLTSELLIAITQHLVMPRLPMVPTPSNNSSRPASCCGRSSTVESIPSHRPPPDHSTPGEPLQRPHHHHHHHGALHRLDSLSKNSELSYSRPPSISQNLSRILVVGDAQRAHGLGSLNAHLSLSTGTTFPSRVDRASDIVPDFMLSDPRTYNSLIHHIEASFYRLKAILNPKACYRHQSSLPTSVRNDFLNLVNCWIDKECYLILLVQVDSFPVPPVRLEFLRTLSRLIPIIPFIPSSVSAPQAIDGHAILTRQLVANRVRHFTIPDPSCQSFPLPGREECLKRSSRSCLDWLTVEFTSGSSSSICPSVSSEDELVSGVNRKVSANDQTDEFKPDKISERVARQIKRRDRSKVERRASKKTPRSGVDKPVPRLAIDRDSQPWLSTDALGLPSLAGLLRLSLCQVRQGCGLLFHSLMARLLHSSHFAPSLKTTTHIDPRWITQSQLTASSNHVDGQPGSRPHLLHTSGEASSQPSKLPSPSSPSAATLLMIGFVTATTAAALTIWCRL